MKLTPRFVESALRNTAWDLGNGVLYQMCRQYPAHDRDDAIIGKLWLIGRTYAAALERRRQTDGVVGDRFYTHRIAPAVRRAEVDKWISEAEAEPENANAALRAHSRLTGLFRTLTGIDKVSLASKYLHFHVPSVFFIYDSRALQAIRTLTKRPTSNMRALKTGQYNDAYARFYFRCTELSSRLEEMMGRQLSPRELDKVLLACCGQT